jgi:hypothetical protein
MFYMLEMWLITAVCRKVFQVLKLIRFPPVVPTVDLLCNLLGVQTGTIRITAQNNVQYSIGAGYQNSPEFKNLAPGDYTMSVRFTNSIACIRVQNYCKAVPAQIQFESMGDCISKEYILPRYHWQVHDPNNVSYHGKIILGILWGQILTL